MSELIPSTCTVCSRKQDFSNDGLYLISKGWHAATFHDPSKTASNFGISLRLSYPAVTPNLCPDCVGKMFAKYLERAANWGEP